MISQKSGSSSTTAQQRGVPSGRGGAGGIIRSTSPIHKIRYAYRPLYVYYSREKESIRPRDGAAIRRVNLE